MENAKISGTGQKVKTERNTMKTEKPVLSISIVPLSLSSNIPPPAVTIPTGVFQHQATPTITPPHLPSPNVEFPGFMHANKSAVQLNDGQEQRPSHMLRTPSYHRRMSRSTTDAELAAESVTQLELLDIKERLLNEEPPMSLDEAREDARARRASIVEQLANIKIERKACIDFVRNRTTSRAAQLGLPSPAGEGFPVQEEDVTLQLPERVKRGQDGE